MKTDEQIDNWKTGRNLLAVANLTTAEEVQDTIIDLSKKGDPKSAAYQRELTRLVETLGSTYTQIMETTARAKENLAG